MTPLKIAAVVLLVLACIAFFFAWRDWPIGTIKNLPMLGALMFCVGYTLDKPRWGKGS